MCGVFGWLARDRNSLSHERLKTLTDSLAHRGPDGSGTAYFSTADNAYVIGFGHRRLSIIDLTDAASQPMWSDDGVHCLTFNGEIYNYLELRPELEAAGWWFRSSGDTEVLMAALAIWGTGAFKRIRGMYAFAYFDRSQDMAILARDAFGKKPLFIARSHGGVCFSSEIAPLRSLLGAKAAFNVEALDDFLLDRYVGSPSTFFKSIEKLPAGCYAVWRKGELAITRHFTPPISVTRPTLTNFEEATELFRSTFDEAVRIRMRSDAAYGLFLSGGLDSSAVLAVMAKHSSRPIRTFTVGFNEQEVSEVKSASLASRLFGTEHQEVIVDPSNFVDHWEEAVRKRGAPVSEASDIPIIMLSHHASKTVKVVLTGEGSDEFFAGYPKYLAERYTAFYHHWVPQAVHDRIVSPLADALPFGMRRVKVMVKAMGERDNRLRVRLWFGGLTVSERDALFPRVRHAAMHDPFPVSIDETTNVRRAMFFDQASWLPDNTLERGDRMLMAAGVEGRMPFMDVELAKLAARMPDEVILRHGKTKAVLRAAMRDILPRELLERKKIGFKVPIGQWFRTVLADLVKDLLCSDRSRVRSILNKSLIDTIVDSHMRGRRDEERILWSLTNLEQFLRVHDIAGVEIKESIEEPPVPRKSYSMVG